jgi:thiamine biosynthesis lipoprotein
MSVKIRSILITVMAACLITATHFCCRPRRQVELESGYRLVMGTFARVVAVAEDSGTAEKCIEAALAEIHKVDYLMSDYKSDSEISRLNRDGFKEAVRFSQSTYEVLQRSIEFSRLTDGAFDITVGPLVDLFRTEKEKQVPPSPEEISEAKSKVGFEKLKLDAQNRTVQFTVEGMRLDLGGIAKGYAIDQAIEAMQTAGAVGGMVDIGGDIRCFGAPLKNKPHWTIGLQNPKPEPDAAEQDLILKVKLADGAVATSGDYQQFVTIEGKHRSHIIDRRTGTSAEGLSSVTVIADNATDADALATAVSVMGAEKGLALIEKLPGTEAILITSRPESVPSEAEGYTLLKSTGAEKYIK